MNNIKVLLILIAIVFLCAGIGAGILIASSLNSEKSDGLNLKYNAPDTFEAGWEAAKKKIEETPYIPTGAGSEEIKSIKGRITSVESNKITIEARLLNPLDDEKLTTRVVNIGDKTEIIIREEKNMDDIRQEHDEYNKKMEDYSNGKLPSMPEPPEVYIEKNCTIKDLVEGQTVTIESEKNIREALEFNASKVLVR